MVSQARGIEIFDKSGHLVQRKGGQGFECTTDVGASVTVTMPEAEIDFHFTPNIDVKLTIDFSKVEEFSVIPRIELGSIVKTGMLDLSSGLGANITCKLNLDAITTPAVTLIPFSFQLGVRPEIGFEMQATVNGPGFNITGPSGSINATLSGGIIYTDVSGWDTLGSILVHSEINPAAAGFDAIAFVARVEPYVALSLQLIANLGPPLLGLELVNFEFLEARRSAPFNLRFQEPFDPADIAYMGPIGTLNDRSILTLKAEVNGQSLDSLLVKIGIDNFSITFKPLAVVEKTIWQTATPVIESHTATVGVTTEFSVSTGNSDDRGDYEVFETFTPAKDLGISVFTGSIANGLGSIEFTPESSELGTHVLYPRVSIDPLSDAFPYANASGVTVVVSDDVLITDIVFPDANLEACVLEWAALYGWTVVSEVNTLWCSSDGIGDLTGLEQLTLLTFLDLIGNQITEVSALGSLTQLTFLNLIGNQITEVSALGSLTQLTQLRLNNNQITDVSALGSLTQLTFLFLNNNQITDVSALGFLTQLTWLDLNNNQITDVSALVPLTQLGWLDLSGNNNEIPCSQLALLSGVPIFSYDNYYDVDGDGQIVLPPDGVDQECGPF